jgi:hypothetical protein
LESVTLFTCGNCKKDSVRVYANSGGNVTIRCDKCEALITFAAEECHENSAEIGDALFSAAVEILSTEGESE